MRPGGRPEALQLHDALYSTEVIVFAPLKDDLTYI